MTSSGDSSPNRDPLEEADPLDDPMLDALERRMMRPPGSEDPLACADDQFVDANGRMLDALEASIEDGPPVFSVEESRPLEDPLARADAPLADGTGMMTDPIEGGTEKGLPTFPNGDDDLDNSEAPAMSPSLLRRQKRDKSDQLPVDPRGDARPSAAGERPHRGTSGGGSRRHVQPRSHGSGAGRPGAPPISRGLGRASAGIRGSQKRLCLDTRDLVDVDVCDSCDRYRHWPEGTDEEPRECWHEWHLCQTADGFDDDDED